MWKEIVEIAILWFVIYHILLFFEGTRAVQVLRGIIVLLVVFLLVQRFELTALDWVLTKLFGISVIAILVIFHPEIRQGLARLGQRHLFGTSLKQEDMDLMLIEISNAAEYFSKNKIGALIAIEREDPLGGYAESGMAIDSKISEELLETIFTPSSPLHDGGVIVQHGRVLAAGCLFPLTQGYDLSRIFGTRHRAALGISEETDAIVLVVSEERKDMSLVFKGKLHKDLGRDELLSKMKEFYKVRKNHA